MRSPVHLIFPATSKSSLVRSQYLLCESKTPKAMMKIKNKLKLLQLQHMNLVIRQTTRRGRLSSSKILIKP